MTIEFEKMMEEKKKRMMPAKNTNVCNTNDKLGIICFLLKIAV